MGESSKICPTKVRYFCPLCTKNYAYNTGLRRHMRLVHENVSANGSSFKCQKCQKPFPSARSLGAHTVHCNNRTNLNTTFFKCMKCSNVYSNKHARDRHEILCSNNATCGVSTRREREAAATTAAASGGEGAVAGSSSSSWSSSSRSRQGSGFNVQFGGGGGRTTRSRTKWHIKKVRHCLNDVAVTYRATPNIEINTIGGVYHAMQSLKTIIVDHFKKFHGVKVHFNVEGMYTSFFPLLI